MEVRLRRGGQHVALPAVAHLHAQGVRPAAAHQARDLEDESRAAAPVFARVAAVHEQVGGVLHAVELHEEPFALPLGGHEELALVGGGGAERRPGAVPRVGQRHDAGVVAAVLVAEKETPPLVERIDGACRRGDARQQQCKQQCGMSFHCVFCV